MHIEGRMLKVEVISTETIKPSSPTPLHLRSFKLSLLDQHAPRIYIPILLFYPTKESDHGVESIEIPHKLKRSLSETLTLFYPLAGRIKEDDTIDCNDEGVDFVSALVNDQLSDFLQQPHVEMQDQLLPCDLLSTRLGEDVPLAIQVNVFVCGGVAIGVRLSHKIADGAGLVTFISNWATMARGANEAMDATLVSASLFPPRSLVSSFVYAIVDNVVTKRLVLDASAIAAIRAKATSPAQGSRPSRVEAVSALIWRCVVRARRDERLATVTIATHAVNLRWRMVPPVPDSYFGNLWVAVNTSGVVASEFNGDMQHCLEMQLRDAIRGVDADFIREFLGPDGAVKAHESIKNVVEKYSDYGIHVCHFTGWNKFPFYEVDYGWGKPIWVSCSRIPIKNGVVFMGTRSGDGMEVWVNMEQDEMAKFEKDEELLSFVSVM